MRPPGLGFSYRVPFEQVNRPSSARLSWDSYASPLRRHDCSASTPGSVRGLFLRPSDSRQTACSVLVVSHHFDGFLRTAGSGVLQPVPARVRRVWPPLDLRSSKLVRSPFDASPRREHPSKNLPHQQLYRIAAAASFLRLSLATPLVRRSSEEVLLTRGTRPLHAPRSTASSVPSRSRMEGNPARPLAPPKRDARPSCVPGARSPKVPRNPARLGSELPNLSHIPRAEARGCCTLTTAPPKRSAVGSTHYKVLFR
jgi:hypothetical protein